MISLRFVFTDQSAIFAKDASLYIGYTVNDNLAYAFKKRMTIKYIHAWDGGTIFDYKTGQLLRGGYNTGNWKKDIKGQRTWYDYVEKKANGEPVRYRQGYRLIYG